MKLEYRIKPVTRYVLTEYQEDDSGAAGVRTIGEYDNYNSAEKVYNAFQYVPNASPQKYIVFMKHQWMYSKEELPEILVYYANSHEHAVQTKEDLENHGTTEWCIAEIKEN